MKYIFKSKGFEFRNSLLVLSYEFKREQSIGISVYYDSKQITLSLMLLATFAIRYTRFNKPTDEITHKFTFEPNKDHGMSVTIDVADDKQLDEWASICGIPGKSDNELRAESKK